MIQQMLAMWSLVPLTLLNPAWTSGISQFTYYWRFTWRILSISLVSCEMSAIVQKFEHSLGLEWNWPFPVLWPQLSFPNLLAYWMQHFNSIIFRTWNSSTGIPSPPLALFVVLLPKAHLTSHFRMSSSRWVITPTHKWIRQEFSTFTLKATLWVLSWISLSG